MAERQQRTAETAVVLTSVAVVCVLVTLGAVRGFWASNLHNGVLAVTFSVVGALLLSQRSGHWVARLFLANGLVDAVLYWGRQVGLSSTSEDASWTAWAGWLGVWPTALAIALATWLVLVFPEGRFVSPAWRRIGLAAATLAAALAALSALWPVEYERAAVTTPFPFTLAGADVADMMWRSVAMPVYASLQLLWLVGLVARWRASDSVVRRQLQVLLVVVAAILVALFGGVLAAGTVTPGLLASGLLPLAVGGLLDRLSLARVVEVERAAGRLDELSARENDVLDLMAQGLSNTAIADRLHLSIKTVEPAISSIFRKLGLDDDPSNNRRVLAVVQYWSRAGAAWVRDDQSPRR